MWGVRHGKNYTWSMGCHWLACCFAFSATLGFSQSIPVEVKVVEYPYQADVHNLAMAIGSGAVNLSSPVSGGNIGNIVWNTEYLRMWLHDYGQYDIGRIRDIYDYVSWASSSSGIAGEYYNYFGVSDPKVQQRLDNVLTNLLYIGRDLKDFKSANHSDLVDVKNEISKSIDTNQYYLAAILEELKKHQIQVGASVFSWQNLYSDGTTPSTFEAIFTQNEQIIEDYIEKGYWYSLFKYYGLWQSQPLAMLYDFDLAQLLSQNHSSNPGLYTDEGKAYLNFFQRYLGFGGSRSEVNHILQNVSPFAALKMKYYGTYHITDAITNTVLTTDSNNHTITNQALLDQILSTAQYQALYRENGQTFSNTVASIAPTVGGNTNDVYIASYDDPTNSSLLASITTNDWLNADYDKFTSDFDEDDFVDKVEDSGFRDFDSKLESVFAGTINDLQSAVDGVWIIRLGNVTLGDYFSYTIPDITVQRSTAWLNLVRKAFVALKAICVISFFLFLWNKLRSLAM